MTKVSNKRSKSRTFTNIIPVNQLLKLIIIVCNIIRYRRTRENVKSPCKTPSNHTIA